MTADRAFIGQLADTWRSTSAVCASLADADWDLATDCPGWTVRDQLAHMIGTESFLLGRPAPPVVPPVEHVLNPIGEMNEAWITPRRPLPGSEVLAEFDEVTAIRLAALEAMTDEELEAETPSPIGRVPYARFMDVRVMDCWVHEQDIRRAVGRPGGLDGPAARAALTRLLGSFGFVVGKRVAPPEATSVAIEIEGMGLGSAVEIRDGRAVPIQPGAGDEPSVLILTDAETFACLAAGRWAGDKALDAGRVQIRGDAAIGEAVIRNLATIP
jgi:uncharacterized protein (TIGR03083 family)